MSTKIICLLPKLQGDDLVHDVGESLFPLAVFELLKLSAVLGSGEHVVTRVAVYFRLSNLLDSNKVSTFHGFLSQLYLRCINFAPMPSLTSTRTASSHDHGTTRKLTANARIRRSIRRETIDVLAIGEPSHEVRFSGSREVGSEPAGRAQGLEKKWFELNMRPAGNLTFLFVQRSQETPGYLSPFILHTLCNLLAIP